MLLRADPKPLSGSKGEPIASRSVFMFPHGAGVAPNLAPFVLSRLARKSYRYVQQVETRKAPCNWMDKASDNAASAADGNR
jgi:hypothetical protein